VQLHEIVDAVTADEPPLSRTADDIITAGRRAQRRRRAGFASAGAAGLVAIAVGGVFALPSAGGGHNLPAGQGTAGTSPKAESKWGAAEPFTFTFQGYDAGKFHVQNPIVTSTAYQIASVYMDGRTTSDKSVDSSGEETQLDKDKKAGRVKASDLPPDLSIYAYLTVYRPGAFDPAGIKDGKSSTVAGHKTVQANLPAGLDPKNAVVPGNKLLAWEYTNSAWAVVTSVSGNENDPSFADLTDLIAGLKPSTPRPATLPFTVGYLPDGYEPVQTGTHALPGLSGIAGARDGDFGGATFANPAPATTGLTQPFESENGMVKNSFSIFVTPSKNSNQQAQAGKVKCYTNGFCNVWSADGKVQVQVADEATGANLPEAELKKIAQSIKVANVTNDSTWTPAETALKP
jgi:hypothetical protein